MHQREQQRNAPSSILLINPGPSIKWQMTQTRSVVVVAGGQAGRQLGRGLARRRKVSGGCSWLMPWLMEESDRANA